jgi:hypothetical protein
MWSPKIKKIRRNYGYGYIFLIVKYRRDGHSRPMHDILKSYPTIRSTDIDSLETREQFWSAVKKDLLAYVHSRIVTPADADRITEKFGTVIKPFTTPAKPKINPVSRGTKRDLAKRFPILAARD